jgi:hypothetical protein
MVLFSQILKPGSQGQAEEGWLCLKNIAIRVRIQESGNRIKDVPLAQP